MASVLSGECGEVDGAVSACAVYPREGASKIERDFASEKRDSDVDVIVVDAARIIGTRRTVFSAWEAYTGGPFGGSHSSIMTIAGVHMGQVGHRRLPEDLECLPAWSDERIRAVQAWHAAEYERAYAAIAAVFPECAAGRRGMGEIVMSYWQEGV